MMRLMIKERKKKKKWRMKRKAGSPHRVARSRNLYRSSKTASSPCSQPPYSSRTPHRSSRSAGLMLISLKRSDILILLISMIIL